MNTKYIMIKYTFCFFIFYSFLYEYLQFFHFPNISLTLPLQTCLSDLSKFWTAPPSDLAWTTKHSLDSCLFSRINSYFPQEQGKEFCGCWQQRRNCHPRALVFILISVCCGLPKEGSEQKESLLQDSWGSLSEV